MVETILAIPDLHCPFAHRDAFDFLDKIKQIYKPTLVICLGDELDAHAFSSKFSADPDGMSPKHELLEGISALKDLYKIFPAAKVCLSNHTERPFIKAFHSGLPRQMMKSYQEFLEAPDTWRWSLYWDYYGVRYEHGEGLSGAGGALKAVLRNRCSTVIGHLHSFAGVTYTASSRDLLFGMNTGCLIDQKAYAFKYAAKLRDKPVLGAGVIVDGIPLFIPMVLSKTGRWIRRIV